MNRFLFPERVCVFFACSASNALAQQRPHLVGGRNRGRSETNDLNSPLHATRICLRSVGSDSKCIRRISRRSYAVKEGRDGAPERNSRGDSLAV